MQTIKNIGMRWLLIPKLLYFFLAMFFYELHQFRGPFMANQFGISKREMGVNLGIIQIVAFCVNLAISSLNDRTGKQRVIFVLSLVVSAALFQSFFSISAKWLFWIVYGAYYSLISATLPLLDKIMLDYLAASPYAAPENYGVQRVWSSFGYQAVNHVIETICVVDTEKKDFSNLAVFNIFAASAIVLLSLAFIRNMQPKGGSSANYFAAVASLLVNVDFMYLMFIVLLCGIVRAAMTLYLGMYCTDVLQFTSDSPECTLVWPIPSIVRFIHENKHSTTTLCGIACEILIFFNSAKIIRVFGLLMPLFLAQIAQLIRFICYYYLDYRGSRAFFWCCAIELLKGVCFGLIQSSAAILVSKLIPASLKTTGQMIYNGTFIALGTVLAGLVFRHVFSADTKVAREVAYAEFSKVFLICSGISAFILIVFVLRYAVWENLLFNRQNANARFGGPAQPSTVVAPAMPAHKATPI